MTSICKKIIEVFKKDILLSGSMLLLVSSAFFVPPSFQYFRHIDYKTIACLFCLMITVKGLERQGVLMALANILIVKIKSIRTLTLFLVGSCYLTSMVITNDVALITFVPLTLSILMLCGQEERAALIVVLQTIAANIGSSLTPIGNPQNLYLFFHYHMSISDLVMTTLPYVLSGGGLIILFCLLPKNEPLGEIMLTETAAPDLKKTAEIAALFILSILGVAGVISWIFVLIIMIVCMLLIDRSLIGQVDYGLLFTFVFIFIFVGNISSLAVIHDYLQSMVSQKPLITAVLTSQVISNVPAAVLLSAYTDNVTPILVGVSIGGLGTIIASMASMISLKFYIGKYPHKTGAYLAVFTLLNGIMLAVLLCIQRFLVI